VQCVMLQGITAITKPRVIYSRSMKGAECATLNCHDARFGFAVSAIGDVDLDGYQGWLTVIQIPFQMVLCVL